MARSTYYYHKRAFDRPDKYAAVRRRIKELHKQHRGRYGYRRITASLQAEGCIVNHKTVRRLMRLDGVECRIRKRRYRSAKPPGLAASPNLMERNFHADAPFQKAVTDVTEFDVGRTRVYVSALIDLYDGAVMSLSMSLSNNTDLVLSMFEDMPDKDLQRMKGMMIHSDQGILYRTLRYHELVSSLNITQSMSRRGNCYDNAVAESFFATFKCETIKLYPITSLEQLRTELIEYGKYYNETRLKASLGYKSPFQYRKLNGF